MGELRRPDHPRLLEVEPGRWWLRAERDLAQARPPLSDRLEWAVFGLLSTSQGIDEATFFERVAQHVQRPRHARSGARAGVLESYRDPELDAGRAAAAGRAGRRATSSTASWSACWSSTAIGWACAATCRSKERRRATAAARWATCCPRTSSAPTCRSIAPATWHTLESDRLHLVPARQGHVPVRGRVDGDAHRRAAAPRPAHPGRRDGRPLPRHPARARRAGPLQAGALAAAAASARRAELAYPQVGSPAPTARPRGGGPGSARRRCSGSIRRSNAKRSSCRSSADRLRSASRRESALTDVLVAQPVQSTWPIASGSGSWRASRSTPPSSATSATTTGCPTRPPRAAPRRSPALKGFLADAKEIDRHGLDQEDAITLDMLEVVARIWLRQHAHDVHHFEAMDQMAGPQNLPGDLSRFQRVDTPERIDRLIRRLEAFPQLPRRAPRQPARGHRRRPDRGRAGRRARDRADAPRGRGAGR